MHLREIQNIAIIPARGGSKRFPGKNKFSFAGIPLIVHSIRYALLYRDIIDRIIVSTDDPEIMKLAHAEGVEVVERPDHLGVDNAPTISALKHVLEKIDEKVGNVILLQPTNPLRPRNLLKETFEKYEKGKFDSLVTVTRSYRKLGKITNGSFVPFNYAMGQRSQDLELLYYENGLLYISKASLIKNERILGEKNFPFIVDHPFAHIDIDYKKDLEYAEFLLRQNPND